MRLRQFSAVVWTLICGGVLTLALGLFTLPRNNSLAWALMLAGGGVALIGLALICVRPRFGLQEQRER